MHRSVVAGAQMDGSDLVSHLCRGTGLQPGEAERLVGEVLAFFSETLEEFVCRRHRELRAAGMRNEEIFGVIEAEIPRLRVVPGKRSRRQIRRMIYG